MSERQHGDGIIEGRMAITRFSKSTLHVSKKIFFIVIGVCAVILGLVMPRWFSSVSSGATNWLESSRGIAYADAPDRPDSPGPGPRDEGRSCGNDGGFGNDGAAY